MKIICAWCNSNLGTKEPLGDPAVSHGICERCKAEMRGVEMEKTKQAKHTPGPWYVKFGMYVHAPNDAEIASVGDGRHEEDTDHETMHANAQLIAAAPDLLEALKACRNEMNSRGLDWKPLEYKVDAAIAKAEGRAE